MPEPITIPSMDELVDAARRALEECDANLAALRSQRDDINRQIREISAERERAQRIVSAVTPRKRAPKSAPTKAPGPVEEKDVIVAAPAGASASVSVGGSMAPAAFRPQ